MYSPSILLDHKTPKQTSPLWLNRPCRSRCHVVCCWLRQASVLLHRLFQLAIHSSACLCGQVVIQACFSQGFVQHFSDYFPFIQIVLIALLDKALEWCWALFLACIQCCSTGIYEVGGCGVHSADLHLLVELQEVSKCCVSVESVTEAFFRYLFFASQATLLNTSIFSSMCALIVRCGFCHNFTIVCLSVHAAWVCLFHQGDWLTALCHQFVVWAELRARSFDITPMFDIPYLNGY